MPKPVTYSLHALYIAAFAQAGAPQLALIYATSETAGILYHIRVDRATSPNWQFQRRKQVIDKDMFLCALLRVRGEEAEIRIDEAVLRGAAEAEPAPENDTFGEYGPWVWRVLRRLHELGAVRLNDVEALEREVDAFATESKMFARRDKFPNVAASEYCQ